MQTTEQRYPALKQAALEQYFHRLNDMQKRAVFQMNGPLLILAGAGSGKTTVLINRIENMIRFGNAYHSAHVPQGTAQAELDVIQQYLDGEAGPDLDFVAEHNHKTPEEVVKIHTSTCLLYTSVRNRTPSRAKLHSRTLYLLTALLQTPFQGKAGTAQQLGRPAAVAPGELHRPVNVGALKGVHLPLQVNRTLRQILHGIAGTRSGALLPLELQAGLLSSEQLPLAEQDAALHHVAQFPHVSLPGVALHLLQKGETS